MARRGWRPAASGSPAGAGRSCAAGGVAGRPSSPSPATSCPTFWREMSPSTWSPTRSLVTPSSRASPALPDEPEGRHDHHGVPRTTAHGRPPAAREDLLRRSPRVREELPRHRRAPRGGVLERARKPPFPPPPTRISARAGRPSGASARPESPQLIFPLSFPSTTPAAVTHLTGVPGGRLKVESLRGGKPTLSVKAQALEDLKDQP